ncbi:MAG: response regulator [Pseudomonadota bacterium]
MYTSTPLKILIIDDEPQILKLLSKMLSRKKFNVDTAINGHDGIKKIDSNEYDLVLTDILMPGLTGRHVRDYIKVTGQKKILVIGMSGTPWLLDEGEFDAVLAKPFSMDQVLDVINQLI